MLWYNNSHETFRKPEATGEAAPPGNPVAGEGHDLDGGGTTSRLLCKLCFSMAADLSKGRGERSELQRLPGSSCQAFGTRKEAIGEPFAERSFGLWLQHRSLDHETGGRGNPKDLRNSLSSQPYLATPDRARMELSETRTQGSGKRRGGDRTLEEETLASNKKKPSHLEPIWLFSMKLGFCSFPMFAEPGRQGDRLPSCIISTGEIESRLSPASPFRPSGGIWGFTSDSRGRILRHRMWPSFCVIFCDTSVGMSSSYGIKLSSIRGNRSMNFSIVIQDSMWSGFQDMPLSSIRWNLYGPRRSVDWPIAPHKERGNSSECYSQLQGDFSILSVYSGLVSGPLNCLGKNNRFSINYA